MTIADVQKAIDVIAAEQHDPEAAHGDEDDLYTAVLLAIATGDTDEPAVLARVALTTKDLGFVRWYA